MAQETAAQAKFQCTARNFHVGDGRKLYGPRIVDGEEVDGDIATIPAAVARLGVRNKMGRILR